MVIKVYGHLNVQQRRVLLLALLECIKPKLEEGYCDAFITRPEDLLHNSDPTRGRSITIKRAPHLENRKGIIGFHIRMRRLQLGLRQDELARLASLSRPHLSEIERGIRLPHKTTLSRLQAALGTRIEQSDISLKREGDSEKRWVQTEIRDSPVN